MDKSGHISDSIRVFAWNALAQNAKAFTFFNIFSLNFLNQRSTNFRAELTIGIFLIYQKKFSGLILKFPRGILKFGHKFLKNSSKTPISSKWKI